MIISLKTFNKLYYDLLKVFGPNREYSEKVHKIFMLSPKGTGRYRITQNFTLASVPTKNHHLLPLIIHREIPAYTIVVKINYWERN